MPPRISYKSTFQKTFDKLPQEKQNLVLKALEAIRVYFATGEAGHGLGIKKLYDAGTWKVFEARASLDVRLVWLQTADEAWFCLLGDHDEVRRFLKNL